MINEIEFVKFMDRYGYFIGLTPKFAKDLQVFIA